MLEKLFKEHFLCKTLCADFFYLLTHLRKFWEYFNSILTSYCKASVKHCMLFPLTLKKTCLRVYVYIWLPRNSTCVLKHKLGGNKPSMRSVKRYCAFIFYFFKRTFFSMKTLHCKMKTSCSYKIISTNYVLYKSMQYFFLFKKDRENVFPLFCFIIK